MKTASLALSALAMLAIAPAAAAKKVIHVNVSIDYDDVRVVAGDLYLSEDGARTYAGDLYQHGPSFLLRGVDSGNVSAASATGAAAGSIAGGGAAVSRTGVARNQGIDIPAEPFDANGYAETAYDLDAMLRIEIDHEQRYLRSNPLIISNPGLGQSVIGGAPAGARADQLEALNGLFSTLGKPRLDPKREIKIVMNPDSGFAIINGQAVDCRWATLNRMGGSFARACLADPADLPNGAELMTMIRQVPIEGAGEDDLVGRARQIAETGKFPIIFRDDRYDLPVTVGSITEVDDDITDAHGADRALSDQLAIAERKILATLEEYERR